MSNENKFLEKLIRNFEVSQETFPIKNYSSHWLKFHLANQKNFSNVEELKNFRQKLSLGRDDSIDRKHYLSQDSIGDWRATIGAPFFDKCLNTKNIGNSKDILIKDGLVYDYNQFFQIYYAKKICDMIGLPDKVIWEIGGGYGALAQILFKIQNVKFKYIFTDLPEANLQAAYFLHRHFPSIRIGLDSDLTDGKLSSSDLEDFDIWIITPSIQFDKSIELDLVVNARSMMEMEKKVIGNYFEKIQSHIRSEGIFVCVNRYWKNTVGQNIKLSSFPYDEKWNVLESVSCFKQPHIHFLAVKRCSFVGNIKSHLKELSLLSPKFKPKFNSWLNHLLVRTIKIILGVNAFDLIRKIKSYSRKKIQ